MKEFLEYVVYSNSKGLSVTIKHLMIIITAYLVTVISLRIIRRLISKQIETENRAKVILVFNFSKYVIICFVLLISLSSIGLNVTTLLLGSTALFVGLGFGLQQLFQDIVSGVIILMDKSIRVDDILEVDGKKGKVFEIRLRTVMLFTVENKILIVPNHKLLNESVYNWTRNNHMIKDSIFVGVSYGSDLNLVKNTLLEVANSHVDVLKDPKPMVLFTDFSDSALNFRLIFSTSDAFFSEIIKSDIRFKIDAAFRENNITIPFPQRDIHLINK